MEAQRGKVLRSQSWRSSLCGFSSLFDGTAPFVGARAFLVVVLLLTCRILKYFPYNMTTFDTSVESISCGRPAYCIQTDLNILNEIQTSVWISNFQENNTRFIWANSAALRLWSKTSISAFVSTDIMSGRSVAVKKIHHDLYEDVQVHTMFVESESFI